MKHVKLYTEKFDTENVIELDDKESVEKLEKLKKMISFFNKEENLEEKYKISCEIEDYLSKNTDIKDVDDEYLYQIFCDYNEHFGSFATASVYLNEINDGIEMVDIGYLFDKPGFSPFQG